MLYALQSLLYVAEHPKECLELSNPAIQLNLESIETWDNADYNWLESPGLLQRFIGGCGFETVANRGTFSVGTMEEIKTDMFDAFIKVRIDLIS